ncbi:hypothetical protein CYY_002741 [Polysphondylium violaceum]|uniref:FNIP repeat-containing protein n=1 Tax=Polysphondylium violaceum TaxID=133409 RepID=A0A8J4PXM5_9MYCE|nr:hypothetical protein CYY_002741 [Polysphondylium violaceum]
MDYRKGVVVAFVIDQENIHDYSAHPYKDYITKVIFKAKKLPVGLLTHNVREFHTKSNDDQQTEEMECFIELNALPFTVEKVVLNSNVYQQLDRVGVLPDRLKCLSIARYNNDLETGNLPLSLTSFHLGYLSPEFELVGIPPQLEYLSLPLFSQEDMSVPTMQLGSLNLGYIQNFTILCPLLTNLVSLKIKMLHTRLERGQLPLQLTNLRIDFYNFDFEIEVLPESLLYLTLTFYNLSLDIELPKSLIKFKSMTYNSVLERDIFPESLQIIKIPEYNEFLSIGTIPPNVKRLKMGYASGLDKNYHRDYNLQLIIPSITNLSFCCSTAISSLITIPSSVVKLSLAIDRNFNLSFLKIPDTVRQLKIRANEMKSIPIPESVCEFTFSIETYPPISTNSIRKKERQSFFQSCTTLIIHTLVDDLETIHLPPNLKSLVIKKCESKYYKINYIPKTLTKLNIPSKRLVDKSILKNLSQIQTLIINKKYES